MISQNSPPLQPSQAPVAAAPPAPATSPSERPKPKTLGFPFSTENPARTGTLASRDRQSQRGLAAADARMTAAVRTAPLPKRPKGRLLVGCVLLTVASLTGYAVWDSFFRFQAYGTVSGRVLRVSSISSGIVRSLHVREGDLVRQGQVLATLENRDLRERQERLGDELRFARATLDAEYTELKWRTRLEEDRTQRTNSEYFELWGELLDEQARLTDLQVKLRRRTDIRRTLEGAVSDQELDALRFAEAGQRAKVEKLTEAVEQLRQLSSLPSTHDDHPLEPHVARIENLQAEMTRLRDRIDGGEIIAPVSGRVIKLHFFTGEYAAAGTPLLEVIEEGSLEAVVYVPQKLAKSVAVGNRLTLLAEPQSEPLYAEVTRLESRLTPAPGNLQRYYRSQENLIWVHARPAGPANRWDELTLGSVVLWPSELPALRDRASAASAEEPAL